MGVDGHSSQMGEGDVGAFNVKFHTNAKNYGKNEISEEGGRGGGTDGGGCWEGG